MAIYATWVWDDGYDGECSGQSLDEAVCALASLVSLGEDRLSFTGLVDSAMLSRFRRRRDAATEVFFE